MGKIRILFIYGQLNGGGAERVLLDILRYLDFTKYEVDLCQIVAGGTLVNEVPSMVHRFFLWPDYTLSYKLAICLSNSLGLDYIFKYVLKQKITKSYDWEISFLEGFPLKIHALLNTSAKKITWVHCDLFRFHYTAKQFRRGEELAAYNKMDKIVCVANDTKIAFEKRFPTCFSEKVVIYNPIDKQTILLKSNEFNVCKNEIFTVVTAGRLTYPKKMDRILRIAKRFKDEGVNIRFQILGDGELKQKLLKLSKELEVEKLVSFLGFKKNPYPYIKQADMMFCCSGYEGFSLVICEAMCLGVPVVSTRTSGPIEILGNNRYGLLTEHDDESMYLAVKKMMMDEKLRLYYREQGYNRVEDFSVEKVMYEFENL